MSIPRARSQRAPVPLLIVLLLVLAPMILPGLAQAAIRAPAAAIPTSPVGAQLEWLLGQLNSGAEKLGPKRTAEHFSPEYLEALPAKDLIATIRDLADALAPVGLARFEGLTAATAAEVIITTDAIDDGG